MLPWSWAQEVASSHWKVVVKIRTAMVLVLTRDWKSLRRTLMSFSGMWMSLLFQKYPVITRIRLAFSFLLYAPTLSFRSSINIFHQSWFWHQIVRQKGTRECWALCDVQLQAHGCCGSYGEGWWWRWWWCCGTSCWGWWWWSWRWMLLLLRMTAIYLVFVGDALDYTSFLGTVTCLLGLQEKNRERYA